MILGSLMAEMILIWPWHFGQTETSMLKTRLSSLAQDILFVEGDFSGAPSVPTISKSPGSSFFLGTMSELARLSGRI